MVKKVPAKNSNPLKRYDRAAWLGEALEVLSEQGSANLTVRNISQRLGVTTGSFYWHFKSRDDFIHSLLEYWQLVFTDAIANEIDSSATDPAKQLYNLMEVLTEKRVPRYNIAVRAWAAMDEQIAKVVKVVDKTQIEFVSHLFRGIGFKGKELDMRTRTFVVFMNTELGWNSDLPMDERIRQMKLRYKWFISR